jgi:hypothetical protein
MRQLRWWLADAVLRHREREVTANGSRPAALPNTRRIYIPTRRVYSGVRTSHVLLAGTGICARSLFLFTSKGNDNVKSRQPGLQRINQSFEDVDDAIVGWFVRDVFGNGEPSNHHAGIRHPAWLEESSPERPVRLQLWSGWIPLVERWIAQVENPSAAPRGSASTSACGMSRGS